MENSSIQAKTYVLLDHLRPTAPIFTQITKDARVRHDVLRAWWPYRKVTFTDANGKGRTARLKLNSDTIWMDEQIKNGIPANEKFTSAEREATRFVNGKLTTAIPVVQEFLESIPQFVGFKGLTSENVKPCFKLDDTQERVKAENKGFKLKLRAGNVIAKTSLAEAQDLIRIINGRASNVPQDLDAAQLELASLVEESDEALQKVLSFDEAGFNQDDGVDILISKLVSEQKLSFDAVPDFVCKKRDNTWFPIKQISSEYPFEQRVGYLKDFLTSPKGELLLNDLQELLGQDAFKNDFTEDNSSEVEQKAPAVEENDEAIMESEPVMETATDEKVSQPANYKKNKKRR